MADREIPDLVLLLQPVNHLDELQVYGVGFDLGDGGGIIFKKLITFDRKTKLNTGFAVSGTKLFSVGSRWCENTKHVEIWDLTDWRNRGEGAFPVKCGQTLEGKPCPVVFEFDGRIFALGGTSYPENYKPNPVFEVFDPTSDGWNGLPDPPFITSYSDDICPRIRLHTVIGKTFYIALAHYVTDDITITLGPWKYYSYDILGETWDTVNHTSDVVDVRAKNFIEHCGRHKITRVDENTTVFVCDRNMKVYACDLDSDLDELTSRHPSKKAKFSLLKDSSVFSDAFIPVSGFECYEEELPDRVSNSQMVAHLSKDIYCMVYFYCPCQGEWPMVLKQMVRITMFQALKRSKGEQIIVAKVLDSICFETETAMELKAWCKLKSRV